MASTGSAGLALKAAAVAAMLAMLVLPSSGRCPSLGPAPAPAPPPPPPQAPPPPEQLPPAPAPAPAPRVSCGDCYSVGSQVCYSLCTAPLSEICGCYLVQGRCDKCKTDETDRCMAKCTDDGGCDCGGAADTACADTCSYNECGWCLRGQQHNCLVTCRSQCMSKCNGP